ncbi:MAG: complex I NDUFA9 subunit family protein [Gammaproteobacteria bacterium]|jgi:NADH dehydrogenase|nr:complex I NDUFA9 subunit family protein [Gammaproteobacteria bacterium]
MSKHTICILGGTGFVGHNLVSRLAQDGHHLILPSRNRERNRDLLVLPMVSEITADIHDPLVLESLFRDIDIVINLVGILNESRGRDKSFASAHSELAKKVVAACQKTGVKRLLHMSSLKADAEKGPSIYLRSKGEAEKAVRNAGPDLHWTIFQPSVIFGPGDSFTNRFASLLRVIPVAFPLACPNARFAPVYIGDVCEAFRRCLNNPRTHGKSFQLCGPQIYSLRELVSYIGKLIGVKSRIIGLPDGLARTQARMMELVPGKPFSMDNYRSLSLNSICDNNGLLRLGITPTSLDVIAPQYLEKDSIQADLDQYRKHAGREK